MIHNVKRVTQTVAIVQIRSGAYQYMFSNRPNLLVRDT